jgi:hypothetical protein
MSKSDIFIAVHDRLMNDAMEKIRIIREETDIALEACAVKNFGAVESHADDGFGPPAEPCKVECWHCGEKYSSAEMRRMYRPRMQHAVTELMGDGIASGLSPLWWCRDLECDGAGFGHDLHRVKPRKERKVKPTEQVSA